MQEATSLEVLRLWDLPTARPTDALRMNKMGLGAVKNRKAVELSLIHISEPTRPY